MLDPHGIGRANARTDWIEMRVNLGVVRGLVAGEIPPHEDSAGGYDEETQQEEHNGPSPTARSDR